MKRKVFVILVAVFVLMLACSCPSLSSVVGTESPVNPAPTERVIVPTQAQPSRQVLFQDDFSSTNGTWDLYNLDYKVIEYADGGFRLWVNKAQLDIWSVAYQYFDGDVSVEVDATKYAGPDHNDFGIICRYSEDDPNDLYYFYFFIIGSDGTATIAKIDGQGQTYLSSSGSMEWSSAINTGYATNHIRADCIGNTLTLYVNNQQVMSVVDNSFSAGDVGLMAGTFDEIGVDIRFDNFVVSRP